MPETLTKASGGINPVPMSLSGHASLKTPGIPPEKPIKSQNNLTLESLQPVIMAIATCNFGSQKEDSEPLEWIYTSSNTMVENAISAYTLNLGLKQDTLLTISMNTLDSNVHSLVETTVILGIRIEII